MVNSSLAYGTSLMLGALHALEPGHGKSFLAAYIVGEKLDIRHVFTLGFSLLIAHFFLLTVIALLMRFLIPAEQSAQVHEALSWAGPLLILAFGMWLFWKSFRNHHHHHAHGACHHHSPEIKKDSSLTKTATVGAIGGLLPCPTVIAPLLLSGAMNNFEDAIFYILVYVLGMGIVLLAMILLFFLLKEALVKKLNRASSKINSHLASAALITLVGVVYLLIRIFAHEAHG